MNVEMGTSPFSRLLSEPLDSVTGVETEFERRRGIDQVEVRGDLCAIHVTGLEGNLTEARLRILSEVARQSVSIDFLKMSPGGMSFVVSEGDAGKTAAALKSVGARAEVIQGRSVVLVHAANMRDEEGLIARIIAETISSGAEIDHLSDMHDRVLIVTSTVNAERLRSRFVELFGAEPTPSVGAKEPSRRGGQIIVLKFGGTSVKTKEARQAAALRVISAREKGFFPVVVVSAIGRKGEPYATDTLVSLLREIDPAVDPEPRELDLLMACGEILSSVVFSHTLKSLGQPAISLRGGQAGIRTDGQYGNARILGINPLGIHEAIKRGLVPVVCGFQGVWVQGGLPGAELTTLGRGGSDTTAAGLGAALNADRVEIYTDVDGVKTADPDFVADAPTLDRVTYDEVAEIAHLGAKVLHPRAAEIAMRFGIPLWVKNTFSEHQGTEVVPRESVTGRRMTGVTHSGKLVSVQASLANVRPEHRVRFAARLFETLAKYGVNLHMINLSPEAVGFALPRDQFPVVSDAFDGLVLPIEGEGMSIYLLQIGNRPTVGAETQGELMGPLGKPVPIALQIAEGCTMVSVVGRDTMQEPGVFLSVLERLEAAKIPVLQTSDSEFSLSCLIPESELRRSVQLLHDAFGLSGAQ